MQESIENLSAPFKRGKVKDVYDLGDDQLLFIFTDRVSAYDVVLPSTIPRKGEISIPVEPILAAKLPEPYFDPTTKSDVKDEPVTMEQIEEEGWLGSEQLEAVRKKTVEIYNKMSVSAEKAGFILADLKLEFG